MTPLLPRVLKIACSKKITPPTASRADQACADRKRGPPYIYYLLPYPLLCEQPSVAKPEFDPQI